MLREKKMIPKVRAPCNLYNKEPFPQSHAGEQYMVPLCRSLSLSLVIPGA